MLHMDCGHVKQNTALFMLFIGMAFWVCSKTKLIIHQKSENLSPLEVLAFCIEWNLCGKVHSQTLWKVRRLSNCTRSTSLQGGPLSPPQPFVPREWDRYVLNITLLRFFIFYIWNYICIYIASWRRSQHKVGKIVPIGVLATVGERMCFSGTTTNGNL